MMKITIVSNGFGEDQIAVRIIDALKRKLPSAIFSIFPLVGEGLEYTRHDLVPLHTVPLFPSGGFIRSVKDLLGDIRAGLVSSVKTQRKLIKKELKHSDLTICVGDVYCLIMGGRNSKGPVVFLPTAKSDYFMTHSWVERKMISSIATLVFTRDQLTSDVLNTKNVKAQYCGNPMMDLPLGSDSNLGFDNTAEVVGILPGSRNEAYANFSKILEVISELPVKRYVLAMAPTLSIDQLALENHLILTFHHNRYILHNDRVEILVWSCFEDVINQVDWVIGLAGTANEQAVYRGKTVFAFEGTGPQSSSVRFREQKKLLGDRLVFVEEKKPATIATMIEASDKPTASWEYTSASDAIVKCIWERLHFI